MCPTSSESSEFAANPNNFNMLLSRLKDGDSVILEPGDYKGPFEIVKSLEISGDSQETVIFSTDEPAVIIRSPKVRIRNLRLVRTIGGDKGAPVIIADPGTSPVLRDVKCRGSSQNVTWEDCRWELPSEIDFGEIVSGRTCEQTILVHIGIESKLSVEGSWLKVIPEVIMPGAQEMILTANLSNIPKGTRLTATIKIENDPVCHHIKVMGLSIQVNTEFEVQYSESESIDSGPEIWGFRLAGMKTMDKVLETLGQPDSDYEILDYYAKRDEATRMLKKAIGTDFNTFILRNLGEGREPGQINIELTLCRDDVNSATVLDLLKENYSVSFKGALDTERSKPLRIFRITFSKIYRPQVDAFSLRKRIQLIPDPGGYHGVPMETVIELLKRPTLSDEVLTEDQVRIWEKILEIEQKIAESRQFKVDYIRHNYGIAQTRVTFEILPKSAHDGIGSEMPETNLTERIRRAVNDEIQFIRHSERHGDQLTGFLIGRIEHYNPDQARLKIKLDDDLRERMNDNPEYLPQSGTLYYSAYGDIAQIKRKQHALRDFRKGRFQNPNLSAFFFDASQACTGKDYIDLERKDLLLPHANPEQIAAVETVLSSPDLTLIQGPPGTGKTTVIAEICYQVARNGGKTLIASQANLAVDNALSRLVHHPIIRALRRGRAERVEEEGLPFLEDNVIETWLNRTSSHCEVQLKRSEDNVATFTRLLESSDLFDSYLKSEKRFSKKTIEIQNELETIKHKLRKVQISKDSMNKKLDNQMEFHRLLMEILDSKNLDWDDSLLKSTSDGISLYVDLPEMHTVRQSMIKIRNHCNSLEIKIPSVNILQEGFWYDSELPLQLESMDVLIKLSEEFIEEADRAVAIHRAWQSVEDRCEYLSNQVNYAKDAVKNNNSAIIRETEKYDDLIQRISVLNEWRGKERQITANILGCAERRETINQDSLQIPDALFTLDHWKDIDPLQWQENTARLIFGLNARIQHKVQTETIKATAAKIKSMLSVHIRSISETSTEKINYHASRYRNEHLKNHAVADAIRTLERDATLLDADLRKPRSFFQKLLDSVTGVDLNDKRAKCKAIEFILDEQLQRIGHEQNLNIELRQLLHTFFISMHQKTLETLKSSKIRLEESISTLNKKISILKREAITLSESLEMLSGQRLKNRKVYDQNISSLEKTLRDIVNRMKGNNRISISAKRCMIVFPDIEEPYKQFRQEVSELIRTIDLLKSRLQKWEAKKVVNIVQKHVKLTSDEILDKIKNIESEIQKLEENQRNAEARYSRAAGQIREKREWWQTVWEAIPPRLRPKTEDNSIYNIEYLKRVRDQFRFWRKELELEKDYLEKYRSIVRDWITRIRDTKEQDLLELKTIYLDNANVIGITCSQAASRYFSDSFTVFDVVVIDEVSKCTPPELLIPALKGKKIVMVGDYRQLPPMFRDDTIEDIAANLGYSESDLQFLKNSLFKTGFESADASNRKMLNRQYRMHPVIMNAINQFYDNRLICGIENPDDNRSHGVDCDIIQSDHHLIWITVPRDRHYAEKRDGTSYYNPSEVEAILKLCTRINTSWSEKMKVEPDIPRKEVGIITFYLAQLKRIENVLENSMFKALQIRIGTVDRFQGMEKPIVIVSTVRNNSKGDIGFARKIERINVAFSRAQELLIIVGCHDLFVNSRFGSAVAYRNISTVVRKHKGFIHVSEL